MGAAVDVWMMGGIETFIFFPYLFYSKGKLLSLKEFIANYNHLIK